MAKSFRRAVGRNPTARAVGSRADSQRRTPETIAEGIHRGVLPQRSATSRIRRRSTYSRSQTGTRDRSESLGFDSGCRWTASPLRSSGGLNSCLRDNYREHKQNGPGWLKVGSPTRRLELQNRNLARAPPAVVLNSYSRISLPWVFSGGQIGRPCLRYAPWRIFCR